MNTETGNVLSEPELIERFKHIPPDQLPAEERKWTRFGIGEVIQVKGINFLVHDVSDQRLVLKFKK